MMLAVPMHIIKSLLSSHEIGELSFWNGIQGILLVTCRKASSAVHWAWISTLAPSMLLIAFPSIVALAGCGVAICWLKLVININAVIELFLFCLFITYANIHHGWCWMKYLHRIPLEKISGSWISQIQIRKFPIRSRIQTYKGQNHLKHTGQNLLKHNFSNSNKLTLLYQ